MPNAKITFLSLLIDVTDVEELSLQVSDNSDLRNLLDQLALKFGKRFEEMIFKSSNDLNKYVLITINGRDIRSLEGLKTKIQENDEISFIPAIAGG
jgi:molybdopterin synthase sulfur carrier subunit